MKLTSLSDGNWRRHLQIPLSEKENGTDYDNVQSTLESDIQFLARHGQGKGKGAWLTTLGLVPCQDQSKQGVLEI